MVTAGEAVQDAFEIFQGGSRLLCHTDDINVKNLSAEMPFNI